MIIVDPKIIFAELQASRALIFVGHEEPDGDCVASQLVLGEYFVSTGKNVGIFSSGPFDRQEIRRFSSRFETNINPELLSQNPTLVLLDCSTIERIGRLAQHVQNLHTVVIDHHLEDAESKSVGDLRFVDSSAPATAYLVQLILEAGGVNLNREQAKLLFLGLCTDTGFFRHVKPHDTAAFAAATRLVAKGAAPQETYDWVYGNRDINERRLLGTLLERTETHYGERVLFTYQMLSDIGPSGNIRAGNDELYSLLGSVEKTAVVILVRERDDNLFSVSLRSTPEIDVSMIARCFGGGGHRQAAGFSFSGTLLEARTNILGVLASQID